MSKESKKASDPLKLEQHVIRLVHDNLMKLPENRRMRALDYLREVIGSSVSCSQQDMKASTESLEKNTGFLA